MRALIILRGLWKGGKLDWVKQNGLSNFLLDIGHLKKLYYRPDWKGEGVDFLTNSFDDLIYRRFLEILALKLGTGNLVVVDSDNTALPIIESFGRIFGYSIFYHTCQVPEDYSGKYKKYIDPHYICPSRKTIQYEIEEFGKFNPQNWNTYDEISESLREKPFRCKDMNNILVVGDLHSHYTKAQHLISKNPDLLVCLGDYIDGPEEGGSRKLIDMILADENPNHIWLEGNHEKRLRMYLGSRWMREEDKKVAADVLWSLLSQEFKDSTMKEFEDIENSKDMIEALNDKLHESFVFIRSKKTYICTHAGLKNIDFLNPKFIGNVISNNRNIDRIDMTFSKTYKKYGYNSLHGHCISPSDLSIPGVVNLDSPDKEIVRFIEL